MTSYQDVELIPDQYFIDSASDLPVRQVRYYYLQHLRDNNQLDSQTEYLLDQPDFYYNFMINNYQDMLYQLLSNDIMLNIALNMNNLDDVIDMTLVNSELNQKLKNPFYLQIIKDNVGITRPVIDWLDLLRENSIINPTKYAQICNDVTDYPNGERLLINAVVNNKFDLVELYWKYFDLSIIESCNSIKMFQSILHQCQNVLTINSKLLIKYIIVGIPLNCVFNKQFLPDYFKFIYYKIRPEWPQTVLFSNNNAYNYQFSFDNDDSNNTHNYQLLFDDMFENAIIYDYPLDILFNSSQIIQIENNQLMIDNNTYTINIIHVGPNNLKYINNYDKILKNPRSEMMIQLLKEGVIYTDKIIIPDGLNDGLGLVIYLHEELGLPIISEHIHKAITNDNWNMVEYLISKCDQLTPIDYYIGNVNLRGFKLLYQLFPDQFDNIISKHTNPYHMLGGSDDDPSCIEFINDKLDNYDFASVEKLIYILELDNIKSLATIYKIKQFALINDDIIQLYITRDQSRRLLHYIKM